MIRHIKSALFILPLLLLGCSGNKLIEGNQQENVALANKVDEFKSFRFVRSFPFCDNPYAALSQAEADDLYQNKEIRLNIHQGNSSVDWDAVFFEGAKECIESELGISVSSAYLHTDDTEDFPFDNVVGLNKEYAIVAQDGFFFVFSSDPTANKSSGNSEKSLSSEYAKCTRLSIPLDYSYDLVNEWKGFIPLENSSAKEKLSNLSDLQVAKLPDFGNVKTLLVSGVLESGQSELYLLTLNDHYEIVDKLQLYTFVETEEGGIATLFHIKTDHTITINKKAASNEASDVVESVTYEVKANGKIRPV